MTQDRQELYGRCQTLIGLLKASHESLCEALLENLDLRCRLVESSAPAVDPGIIHQRGSLSVGSLLAKSSAPAVDPTAPKTFSGLSQEFSLIVQEVAETRRRQIQQGLATVPEKPSGETR